MKIAAYCRVSTEKEAQIDSLEKQIEFFNEFTKKNGYELYKLYADEGISGKQIKHRKQFQQMMIDAKAKKFDKVVVKDVSRFARNTVDLLQSVRELKSYGVQVDFLNNGEVMEGGSEFILTILGAMAQQESANMSKRVKFGKDITAKKGRVPNLVFGYDKIPDERYTLKINEEEAKIVKEIFESYVYKGIGTTKIAWNLNDRGIRTKKTKSKWVQTSIVRMLKNPIYTGRVTNKKSEVTDFITVNKGNIIYLDQYVDHVENIFFMRIEWELKDFLVPQEKIEDYFATLYAQKYEMNFRLYFSDTKPRMAIFVSKMSHCLFDLLARYTAGEWNVEIPLIISNHPDLQHVAERFGIPFHLFPITKETKEEQEKKEMELLAKHKITFIVLARYMQVISEQMINAYPNRIINIHHSFLPAFVGAKPYHAAFERGVKIIGATSHYVTTELDAGPIIEQDVVRITHKDTVQDLVNKGKDLEKIVLSRAVQKHIERKVLAYKNKTVIFN